MKTVVIYLFLVIGLFVLPAHASGDFTIQSGMQSCNTNDDCTLTATSCKMGCANVPINKASAETVLQTFAATCGVEASSLPVCNINPPLTAACINKRCTLETPFKYNASAKDYSSPSPERPVANKANSRGTFNDRDGKFTAYDLPPEVVRQNMLGQYKDFQDASDVSKIEPAAGVEINGTSDSELNSKGLPRLPTRIAYPE